MTFYRAIFAYQMLLPLDRQLAVEQQNAGRLLRSTARWQQELLGEKTFSVDSSSSRFCVRIGGVAGGGGKRLLKII